VNKTIYVKDDDLWERVVVIAKRREISVSTLIENALSSYLEPSAADKKLQRIAQILAE
jgi:predicted transcriptional regulator